MFLDKVNSLLDIFFKESIPGGYWINFLVNNFWLFINLFSDLLLLKLSFTNGINLQLTFNKITHPIQSPNSHDKLINILHKYAVV